jgi:very-short-patch-repair endonuclease
LKSHGVMIPLQSEEVKKRMKQTVNEKYGVDSYSKTDEFKEKVAKTWLDRIETTKQFELIMQLNSNEIELLDDFVGFKRGGAYVDYRFKCKRCNSVFNRKFCNPTIPICRKCYPSPKSPRTHDAIRDMLKENNVVFAENSRRILKGLELDFFLENDNLAVELNGNYFHSERAGDKSKDYHLNKTTLSTDKGIRLIHVFEDEIMKKKDIVIGRIMALLNKSSVSIGARKCKVVECSFEQKKAFFSENHIQGDTPSKIAIGLMHKGQLVAIMSFGTPRKALGSKNGEMTGHYELLRFCNKIDHNVAGAFSKILSHFKKHYDPKHIITFADIRWSGYDPSRTVYAKNGFEFESFSRPNYWYFKRGDYMTRYHRFKFRKDVLVKQALEAGLFQNEDEAKRLTEWELAQLMGMDRIWDCGNMKFSWSFATKHTPLTYKAS